MKKLVIASAVAAVMASGVVAAETSMYGNMRLQMTNQSVLSMDSTKLVVGFKAAEDLGNGMTAYTQLELEHDDADAEVSGWTNDVSFVGVKGDFGAVQLGAQKDAAGFACGGTDIFIYNSGSVCGVGAVNGTLDDAVVYVGAFDALTVVAGMTFGGDFAVEDSDTGTNHTVIALNYAAGDIQVGFQQTSFDEGDDVFVLGGTYALGDIKIGLTLGDDSNESATALAVQAPVAGGTIKVGFDTGEDAGVADTTNLEFDKKLGKTAYWGAQFSSVDGVDDDLMSFYIGKKF